MYFDHSTSAQEEPSADAPSDLWRTLLYSTDSWAASEDSPAKPLTVGCCEWSQKATPTSWKSPHVLLSWKIAQGERRKLAFMRCSFSHVSTQKGTCGRLLEGKAGLSAVSFLFLTFQNPSFSITFSSPLFCICLGSCSASIPSQCIF